MHEGLILDHQLSAMLEAAAEVGAMKALKQAGHLKAFMSFNEAAKTYGKAQVNRWIASGEIKPLNNSSGGRIRLDRVRLATLSVSQSLIKYVSLKNVTR